MFSSFIVKMKDFITKCNIFLCLMERISSFCVFFVCVVCLKIKVFAEHKAAVFVVVADFEVKNKKFVWSIGPAEHLKV